MNEKTFSLFQDNKHFIHTPDINGDVITTSRLQDWACRLDAGDLICIFCGTHATRGFPICPICKEFKGLYPNC